MTTTALRFSKAADGSRISGAYRIVHRTAKHGRINGSWWTLYVGGERLAVGARLYEMRDAAAFHAAKAGA